MTYYCNEFIIEFWWYAMLFCWGSSYQLQLHH